jgi:ATP-dependent RNA helicase DDX52/ROK1
MDIFKLLARSSNLQKSGPTFNRQQIPSAGTPNQGNVVVKPDDVLSRVPESHPSSNRKRKREGFQGHGLDKQESQIFSSSPDQGNQAPQHLPDIVLQGQTLGVKYDGEVDSALPMSEEECRRFLKQHKLKITLLNTETNFESVPAKGNKKDEVPRRKIRRKDTFVQLTPCPLTSFKQLRIKYGISKRLAENLDLQGYATPTEVQIGSLPILLGTDQDRGLPLSGPSQEARQKSEVDLLTVAPTGSGKTLAFLIHLIQGLLEDTRRRQTDILSKDRQNEVRALVIAPTHELADQIVNEGRKLMIGTGLKISGMKKGMRFDPLSLSSVHGHSEPSNGAEQKVPELLPESQEESLIKTDILVSTPMMLVNSISSTPESTPTSLPGIRYLVLDEADILLDPLFRSQTLSIWSACTNPTLKTSLWSATIGSSIESLAISFINDRRRNFNISPSQPPHHIIRLVVGLKDSAVSNISHRLIYAATEQGKLLALRQMLHPAAVSAGDAPSIQPPFLIFTQTIPRAIALHAELLYDIPLEAGGSSRIAVLHSDLSVTMRAAIIAGFRRGEVWILITTDLLSRGVDFRGINGVVNYDIPNTGAAYIHRVGRTGRQQREGGMAVTLYTKEDIPYVKNIANVIARSEKLDGKDGNGEKPRSMEKWLLDALPDVTKKTKKELKKKGVESRRISVKSEGDGRMARKMRISTKSGYDRGLEHRRKEALARNRQRVLKENLETNNSDEGWEGIPD